MLLYLISSIFLLSNNVWSIDTFYLRGSESNLDDRFDYDNKLIILALDKTVEEYGPYKIKYSEQMNFARAYSVMETSPNKIYIFKSSYGAPNNYKNLGFVNFPVDLGVVGYRVCFINKNKKKAISNISNLDQIKNLVHGQGRGWQDGKILKSNGHRNIVISKYENLFRMVEAGRIDLFCRGANEIFTEYKNRKNTSKNLAIDETILFKYDLPRFFYLHKNHKDAIKRLTLGLERAYADGSMIKLWKNEYEESVKFSKLKSRKVIHLENSYLDGLSPDYKKYFIDLLK